MLSSMPVFRLSLDHARAVFIAAQGLGAEDTSLAGMLERAGFVRTLGGADVYLAARARVPGMGRADLDAVVDQGQAQVVPAVRGCIYLVARRHVPLALRIADLLSRARAERDQHKAGVRPGEIADVARAVVEILASQGPLTTAGLRKVMPDGVVRSLGDAGKKVGVSSTLPPALRVLEFDGKIERTLEDGRLDTERYLWRVARSSPFEGADVPDEPAALHAQLADIFFRAAGIGTHKDFAAWAGIGQRDARAAMARTPLLPVIVEGMDACFAHETHRDLLADAHGDAVALCPFDDNLVALHGGPALLVDPAHHGVPVPVWGRTRGGTLGDARHIFARTVVAGGRIAGLWEYDPDARTVVLGCFDTVPKALRKRLDALAADTARFLADDLGHGHCFPMDTDDAQRQRAALVRGASA